MEIEPDLTAGDETVITDDTPVDDTVDADAEVTQLSRGEVAEAVQTTALPIPSTTAAHLPLQQLDPGVFERLVTEIVTRRDNRGAFFYGSSGRSSGVSTSSRIATTGPTMCSRCAG